MHLAISKEKIVELLGAVTSVVERKHTLVVLSNVKITISEDDITITGSDLEVELVAKAKLEPGECKTPGEICIPAKKLHEICKALPAQAIVNISINEDQRCHIKSKQSKFTLSTSPGSDFPLLVKPERPQTNSTKIQISNSELKRLFDKTSFAMAVSDVRYYLNGTLIEIDNNIVRAVTTDGHRLAICETSAEADTQEIIQAVLPKKSVIELQRLTSTKENTLHLNLDKELIMVETHQETKDGYKYSIQMTTKLIDGRFPEYKRVTPVGNDKIALIDVGEFKQAIHRVSILSNEKLKNMIFRFTENNLDLKANNPDQDQAIEDLAIDYNDEELELSFNSQYIIDVLNVISHSDVQIEMAGETKAILLTNPQDSTQRYVVMPMRI